MAIVGVPGWIGESAVNETGQRWMDAAMRAVRVSVPGWMSSMAGQSKEVYYSIGASNSYNKDTLINYLKSQGSTPVVVTITGNLVSSSAGQPCLDFPSSLTNAYVTLIVNSGVTVYGRGGRGAQAGNQAGEAGGTAINNGIGTRLRITNNGAIAGGGGGGGAQSTYNSWHGKYVSGGGGGRPFGAGGSNGAAYPGGSASLTAPGAGGKQWAGITWHGGDGGNVGERGKDAARANGFSNSPGAAGKAVTGNAPTWTKVGTIYGSRV